MILCFIGPSASGKTSTLEYLINKYPEVFDRVITNTTRAPRPNEIHGVHYYFLTTNEFLRKKISGEIFESSEYPPDSGKMYGTDWNEIERILSKGKTPIVILDWNGYQALLKKRGENLCKSIFFYRDADTIAQSLLERGSDPNEIALRLINVQRELKHAVYADKIVKSNNIEETYWIVEKMLVFEKILKEDEE